MPRRPFRSLPLVAVLYALLLGHFAAATASAQEEASTRLSAPRLFPDKTLAYLRIDDVQQLKLDLSKSSVGKLASDDQIKPILSEFYGSLVNTTSQLQDNIGLNLDELLSIPSGELAIALLPNDRGQAEFERRSSNDEEGGRSEQVSVRVEGPAVAILLDAGDEISGVQIMLQRMEEARQNLVHEEKTVGRLTLHRYQNPERRDRQFAYFIDEGVIVACSDADYVELLAEKWLGKLENAKTLADNKTFTSIMSRCVGTDGERPQVSFYADPMAMIRQFAPRNAGTSMTLSMLPALGLDGIEGVGGSWILAPEDFDSISHMHLQLKSPRRNVLSLLRPKSGSTTPEAWVPDTVAGYSSINWDIQATVAGVERLYNLFRGDDALNKEVFQRANDRLEIDIRKDILENLEGRITIMQGFVRPVTINSGSNVYAFRMNNIEAFKSNVMPKLMALIEERTEVSTERFGPLSVRAIEVPRRQPEDAPIRQPEICFTTIDDYLVIADSKYMLRQIADCLLNRVGPLNEAIEYQLIAERIQAQLQDKECAAITFSRPEESLQLFYELARDPKNRERLRSVADRNGFFKSLLTALEKHELPPFSVIAKYLAPGGGFVVDEETGLHYTAFSLRRE